MFTLTRRCLATINTVFLLAGLATLPLGGLLYLDTSLTTPLLASWARPHLAMEKAGKAMGVTVLVCGLLSFAVSLFGCVGSLCDVRVALVLYSLSLLTLIATELFFVFFLFTSDGTSKSFLERGLEMLLRNYNETKDYPSGTPSPTSVRKLFTVFECCGIHGFSDYSTQRLSWTRDARLRPVNSTHSLPLACCRNLNGEVSGARHAPGNKASSPVTDNSTLSANGTVVAGAHSAVFVNGSMTAGARLTSAAGANRTVATVTSAAGLSASPTTPANGSLSTSGSESSRGAADTPSFGSVASTTAASLNGTRNGVNKECLVRPTAVKAYLDGCLPAIRRVLDSLRGWIVTVAITSIVLEIALVSLAVKQCVTENLHLVYEQTHVGRSQPAFDVITVSISETSPSSPIARLNQSMAKTELPSQQSVCGLSPEAGGAFDDIGTAGRPPGRTPARPASAPPSSSSFLAPHVSGSAEKMSGEGQSPPPPEGSLGSSATTRSRARTAGPAESFSPNHSGSRAILLRGHGALGWPSELDLTLLAAATAAASSRRASLPGAAVARHKSVFGPGRTARNDRRSIGQTLSPSASDLIAMKQQRDARSDGRAPKTLSLGKIYPGLASTEARALAPGETAAPPPPPPPPATAAPVSPRSKRAAAAARKGAGRVAAPAPKATRQDGARVPEASVPGAAADASTSSFGTPSSASVRGKGEAPPGSGAKLRPASRPARATKGTTAKWLGWGLFSFLSAPDASASATTQDAPREASSSSDSAQ